MKPPNRSSDAATRAGGERFLTARSLLFSAIGVLLIAGLSGFHDDRMFGSTLAVGNHLPVAAFGYLFFLGLVWNGLVGRLRPSLMLNGRELAVVMIACLVACFAATSGFARYLHRGIIMPWHYLATGGFPEWRKYGLLEDLLSPALFPSPTPYRDAAGVLHLDQTVYRGFFTGMATGRGYVGLSEIPFRAWGGALMYWGPLVVLCAFASMALAFLVHRQWSQHEQLSYPIAQIAGGFCQRADGRAGVPDIYRAGLFWVGFLPLLVLYLLQYLNLWYPETVPGMEQIFPALKSWTLPVTTKFPLLAEAPMSRALDRQTTYFCVVGLAYFVSSEISLTMGLSAVLLTAFGVWYVQLTGIPVLPEQVTDIRCGAYFGYACVLLYTGRRYYRAVLLRAFRFGCDRDRQELLGDDVGVLAARVLIASVAGFVATLVAMGSSLPMATFYALLLLLMFLVMARIVCETGIPFVQSGWAPSKLMVTLVGPAAIGPRSLMLLHWASNALCTDPRECLLPFAATGARLAEESKLRLRKAFGFSLAVVLVAVVVAFVAEHWTLYNIGPMADNAAAVRHPQSRFDDMARWMGEMTNRGVLADSLGAKGVARLALVDPEPGAWAWLVTAAGAVVLLSLVRFRFAGFPIHPVLLLIWGTYPAINVWGSFLLGWFLKTLVVRIGGGTAYQRMKPLFVGLIASELIASALVIVVDMVYFWVTGGVPRVLYRILPG